MSKQTKSKATKKKTEPEGGLGKGRALLLGALVVVVTSAAMFLMNGDKQADEATPEAVDDGVVILSPAVPTGSMVSASWRNDEQRDKDAAVVEEKGEEAESLFDTVDWADDEKQRGYDKSIERTVSEIHGLGVYVAPLEDEKKK